MKKGNSKNFPIRKRIDIFIIGVIIILCFYAFVLKTSTVLLYSLPANTILSTSLLFFYLLIAVMFARSMPYPLKFYGITLHNWQRSLLESLLLTLPFFIIVIVAKGIIIHYWPVYRNIPLFNPYGVIRYKSFPYLSEFNFWLLMCGFYIIHACIQEVLVRGLLQSLLQKFFTGKHRTFSAILCSNLIFSTFHLFIAMQFAFFIFLPGLFWGWLYARQKTLVGTCASHILLGIWTIFIVSFTKPLY